jgi:RND family efflux transporter MFP subunit
MVSGSRRLFPGASRSAQALAVGLCLSALAGCDQAPVEEERVIRPVRYTRVAVAGSLQRRTYSGTVRAELEADLSFRVPGTLISRGVNVGDSIARGAVVGELDPTDYQVRLQEAQAGLARAQAERRNAQANYERIRDLYENRNASRSELDAARAADESARAQVSAATQQHEAARLQLSYTRLTAPEQCAVAQVFVEQNQNVSAGQPIVRVNCGQCAEVLVSVPEVDIRRIVEGSAVAVTIDALGGDAVTGVVRDVGVATGGTGTTYPVAVALQQRCADVRSGMAADVEFRLRTAGSEGAVIVPLVSVGEDRSGQRYVFVLEPSGSGTFLAVRRGVTLGDSTGEGLTIVAGLTEGELIATAGVRRLADNQEVTLLADSIAVSSEP